MTRIGDFTPIGDILPEVLVDLAEQDRDRRLWGKAREALRLMRQYRITPRFDTTRGEWRIGPKALLDLHPVIRTMLEEFKPQILLLLERERRAEQERAGSRCPMCQHVDWRLAGDVPAVCATCHPLEVSEP